MRKFAPLIALASGSVAPAIAQTPLPPSAATNAQARATPALGAYTQDVLFGDVWKRPGLAPRDRSLIVITALIATGGDGSRMRSHFNRALDNGLKPSEMSALITHHAFYSGWPNAVGAAEVAAEIFEKRGIPVAQVMPSKTLLAPAKPVAGGMADQAAGLAPALAGYTRDHVYGGLWRNSDLSPRDRSLTTIASLIATGKEGPLSEEVNRGLDNGLTRNELSEVVTHLAYYAGWSTVVSSAAAIDGILARRSSPAAQAAPAKGLRIVKNGASPRKGDPKNFSGDVTVRTPFSPDEPSLYKGATVTFAPGARTAWHSHDRGQMLIIVAGNGYVQTEGGPVEAVSAGDAVWTPAGVRHWHGATRKSSMSHVAISDGAAATWGEHVAEPMP